jgi:hypothetical protein
MSFFNIVPLIMEFTLKDEKWRQNSGQVARGNESREQNFEEASQKSQGS